MTHHFEQKQYFEYKGHKGYYALIVTADWQVVLADLCPPSDGWGDYEPETFAHAVHPMLACMIYRWAVREFLNWMHTAATPRRYGSAQAARRSAARFTCATPSCLRSTATPATPRARIRSVS